MLRISLVFILLMIVNQHTYGLDVPANEYYKNFKRAKEQTEKKFEVLAQVKKIPENKNDLPIAYKIVVSDESIHVTPISVQKETLYEWKILGNKITKSKYHPSKSMKAELANWDSEVAEGVSLRDVLFFHLQWPNDYTPELKGTTHADAILELQAKKNPSKYMNYSKINMSMEKMTFLPSRMDFYQSRNAKEISKTYVYKKFTKGLGQYFPRIMEITNPKNQKTKKLSYFHLKRND